MKKVILFLLISVVLFNCSLHSQKEIIQFNDESLEFITFNKNQLESNIKTREYLFPNLGKHSKLKDFFKENNEGWEVTYANYKNPNARIYSSDFNILIYDNYLVIQYNHSWNDQLIKNIREKELSFLDEIPMILLDNYIGQGIIKKDSYTFCSFIPSTIDYEYKYGNWTFWTTDRKLVAKGIFTIETENITTNCKGGADVKNSKIREEDWTFYDEQGNIIPPTKELIHELEKGW